MSTRTRAPMPQLETERLLLRPFVREDGPVVERLAGAREVADTTLSLPHPYPAGAGAAWIATHADEWACDERLTLAITQRDSRELVGAIALAIVRAHAHGEIGYWIGRERWGSGYATEAARRLVLHAVTELGLHRVQARHMVRNPASGRVLAKAGMRLEGVQRDAFFRWGRFEDVALYAILAGELEPPVR
jgi:RimJ/RimL family protein N-acetyltransferase